MTSGVVIARVGEGDLADLLPLMRAYCDFYAVAPGDEDLRALSRELIADPERAGLQLLARDGPGGPALGFATVFWTYSTLSAGRIAVMNDLFVVPAGRGRGLADALIEACAAECRARGITHLTWQTALDNHRAQVVYDRVGATASRWLDYELRITPGQGV